MASAIQAGILPKLDKSAYDFPKSASFIHPLAEMFPEMNTQDFESLKASIKLSGLHQPIVHHEGKIIDGRNRWLALHDLPKSKAAMVAAADKGLFPTDYFKKYDGPTDDAAIAQYVMDANLNRRNMSKSQTACVAAEFHKLTEPANGSKAKSPTMKELAKRWGVSERYIHQAKTLKEQAPEIFEVVKSEEIESDNESVVISLKSAFTAVTDAIKADKLEDLLWDMKGMSPVQIAAQIEAFTAPPEEQIEEGEEETQETPPPTHPDNDDADGDPTDDAEETEEEDADAADAELEESSESGGNGIDVEGAVADVFGDDQAEPEKTKKKTLPAVAKTEGPKEVGFDMAKLDAFFEAIESYIDRNFDPALPHGGAIKVLVNQFYNVHEKAAWEKVLEDFSNKQE